MPDDDLDTKDNPDVPLEECFEIKPGFRLPSSDNEWLLANSYSGLVYWLF